MGHAVIYLKKEVFVLENAVATVENTAEERYTEIANRLDSLELNDKLFVFWYLINTVEDHCFDMINNKGEDFKPGPLDLLAEMKMKQELDALAELKQVLDLEIF